MRSPILLSASATISAGGGTAEFETTRLQNPFRTPMLLDEVRVFVTRGGANPNAYDAYGLGLDLKLGRVPLTKDYVPIANFGKALNDDPDPPGFGFQQIVTGPWTWKLPKPLYIPATEFLVPKIYWPPDLVTSLPRTVTIVYAGRSLEDGLQVPESIPVPYVSYISTPRVAWGSNTTYQSTPSGLVNPFNEPLYVQRFIGRQWLSVGSFVGSNPDATGISTLVRAANHDGMIMIKDPTSFSSVFAVPDRSWTINTVLAPKGFFIFTLDRDYSAYSAFSAQSNAQFISMVGYREVRLRA